MISPEKAYDNLASGYDTNYLRPIDLAEDEVVFALMERLVGGERLTGSVCDLGCGTALFLDWYLPANYVGVDISSGMLAVASKKHPGCQFIHGDMALHIPELHGHGFDFVVSNYGSFSYVMNPVQAVDQMKAILKPGGAFFVMAGGFTYKRRPHLVTNGYVPFMVYTQNELRNLFSGFRDVQVIGLRIVPDGLLGLVPKDALVRLFNFEIEHLQRWGDYGYYQIVYGVK